MSAALRPQATTDFNSAALAVHIEQREMLGSQITLAERREHDQLMQTAILELVAGHFESTGDLVNQARRTRLKGERLAANILLRVAEGR